MIIRSLKEHWPSRTMEWLMAAFLANWGIYVLLHPEIFTQPESAQIFSGMAAMVIWITDYPALVWGWAAFVTGLVRAVALFINGAYTRTPLIRVLTSFASMFIVTQIIIGLFKSGVPQPGLVTYSWIVVADLISAYRASRDAVFAEKQRQEIKGSRRGSSSSSLRYAA